MDDRPRLRVVGGDERAEKDGDITVLIADLEIAHGHVIEARAEALELPDQIVELDDALMVADAAVTKALRHAHLAKSP